MAYLHSKLHEFHKTIRREVSALPFLFLLLLGVQRTEWLFAKHGLYKIDSIIGSQNNKETHRIGCLGSFVGIH